MKSESVSLSAKVRTVTVSPDEFLTTSELMKLIKIKHRKTIYDLVEDGMPAILVGKNYRFIRQEVIDYFKQNTRVLNNNGSKKR